jgi:hypothetical protein
VSLPSSYRSRRGHIHLLRVLPLVGCRSKTPTPPVRECPQAWLPNWVFDIFPNRPSLLHRFVHVFACDSRTGSLTDSRIGHLPKFAPPPARDSGLPHVRDPTSSPNQDPRTSHFREFEASQVPGFRKSWVSCPWKTHLKSFVKLNVSRVTSFPEFPNTYHEQNNFRPGINPDLS